MYNIIFIFIFVLGKTLGTGNNKPSDKEGSSNPYGTGHDPFGYNFADIPDSSIQPEGSEYALHDYTTNYNQNYNAYIPPPIDTSFQTYQGEGSNTHFGQYTQGIPSEQQINTSSSTYLEGLGERFKNVLPSVIVPSTFNTSNNVAQSSLPNLSTTSQLLPPYNNQNVDHSVQYPYNSNNISPYYVGGSSTSAVQNNNFQRGIPQEEQLDSLAQFGELGDIFKTKLRYTHDDVVEEQLQGNKFSNLNYQQYNQEETLPNVETSNTQVIDYNWLKKEHHVTKLSNGKYYNCTACNTKFLIKKALEHINSPKHLQCLNDRKIIKNPERRQEHIEELCNKNYINKIDTNQYKCMPCNGQNLRSTIQLISHTNTEHHKNNLKEYEKKLEQCEMQHLNSDSSAFNSNWRDLAILNSMVYDESKNSYHCILCNKSDIDNKKQKVISHYITKNHTKNIQNLEKEKRDENVARLNAWHIKLKENQIEDMKKNYVCKACNKKMNLINLILINIFFFISLIECMEKGKNKKVILFGVNIADTNSDTDNNPSGEGSNNPYGTGYNPISYNAQNMPDPLPQFQDNQYTPNDYTYNQGYNAYIPPPIDTSFQTYQGEGTSNPYSQYTHGMPSGESKFKNVLPSVIVPSTLYSSNNVIPPQSSLPNLLSNQLHPYNYQNTNYPIQYPYNYSNYPIDSIQNNAFQRGMPQEEQLDNRAQVGGLEEIFKTKPSILHTHKDVVQGQSSLQGNELLNLNNQQNNQEETLPNVETSNTQVLNDNWLKEEHHVTKLSNGKYYNCNACNTHFINTLEHINSSKHLQCLNGLEIIKNTETRQEHIDRLCNENYIIKIKTNQYKCMPCNGQDILRAQRLLPHLLSKQHQDNLIKYEKKLEKGETQHSNNDSSDEDEDWKVKAETNYMFLDSNGKYLCKVCNGHITNVKQNVTGHIASATHKKNIQKKEEKDLEQGLNLFNQEMYGNQPQNK
ncbi:hypothetical protein Mgra_00009230 [Meloidogyne graminicola]|uniref:U1-type domain-containing protein n=1 Tax=Meloidogyne graminicola TaxID=189291 RepID=A0A8S9ZDH4_9BILA|nr:hypothetical protein Mgra_00009230 [Meloidogyne graminicola]